MAAEYAQRAMTGGNRVAVIGGGVSGSVCAALMRSHGLNVTVFDQGLASLGGRASSRKVKLSDTQLASNRAAAPGGRAGSPSTVLSFDTGAQFVAATDRRFQALVESPILKGVLHEWEGRFGVYGAASGQVMPRKAVIQTGMFGASGVRERAKAAAREAGQDDERAAAFAEYSAKKEAMAHPMNFCGFLESPPSGLTAASEISEHRLYTGSDGVGSICQNLLDRASVTVVPSTVVSSVRFDGSLGRYQGKWHVDARPATGGATQVEFEPFDSIVLANHDPAFAATVLEELLTHAPKDPELHEDEVAHTIASFAYQLRGLRDTRTSRYSLMAAFPRALDELDFDAASVHGSPDIQFISRDSSKPGRGGSGSSALASHGSHQGSSKSSTGGADSAAVPVAAGSTQYSRTPSSKKQKKQKKGKGGSGGTGSSQQHLRQQDGAHATALGEVECWVIQCTPEFSAQLDAELGFTTPAGVPIKMSDEETKAALEAATVRVREAAESLLGDSFEGGNLPEPVYCQARRWGSAFYTSTLDLNDPGEDHNDAITFHQWGVALVGDYFGARQGVQEAAISGMQAADRLVGWAIDRKQYETGKWKEREVS